MKIAEFLPHQESCASTFCATIIAVTVRSLAADSTQQSERDEHKNNEQYGADNEASVVAVNAVLSNVIIGCVEMAESVVASDVGDRVDLLSHRVADVEHRLTDSINRHLHFRNV